LLFTVNIARLTHVQLCGEESSQFCSEAPVPVIKVIRTAADYSPGDLAKFPAAAFLVDGGKAGEYGGTGTKSDWELCWQLRALKFTFLAGGLTAKNIASAIAAAQPDALDVSSALESEYGIKDHAKMREFFVAVRAAPTGPGRLREISTLA